MSETSTSENQSQSINALTPVIHIIHGQAMTTSIAVAEYFRKEHRDVLKAIRELDIPQEFSERNFALANYTDKQGKPRPMYEMTRDGFTVLAMGFTGREAMKFKIDYINAFNRMEEIISAGQTVSLLPEGQMIVDKDRWIERQERIISLLESENERLKSGAGSRKRVTPEEMRRIVALSSAGYGYAAIAKEVGRKVETVETVLRRERQRQASLKKEALQ
jgi:Rha family phage regulatory protein